MSPTSPVAKPRVNAMNRPGDQAGSKSSACPESCLVAVAAVRTRPGIQVPLPAGRVRERQPVAGRIPGRVARVDAMRQAPLALIPSGCITHRLPGPAGASVRQNAIRRPAGFHVGPNSFLPGVS